MNDKRFFFLMILALSLFGLIHTAERIGSVSQSHGLGTDKPLDPDQQLQSRPSITFILGEDKPGGNPFYAEATNFYRFHPEEQAEILITHCRSLLEMRNVLEEHAAYQRQPWGTVNVVVHSNQWQGMAVAVLEEGGMRATVESVDAAVNQGFFLPLADSICDQETELIIYGCGLGKNEELLHSLSYAFGGEDETRPLVRSSRQFIYYTSNQLNGMPVNCQRYLSDYWFTHYPSYYHPGNHNLAKRLEKKYPEQKLDWQTALNKQKPETPGEVFSMEFKVPIVWYVTYEQKADRPELETKSEQLSWIKEQEDIVLAAENYGFEVEDFRWTVRKANYEYEEGTSEPAMKAIGFCSIVCVLKPLLEEKEENPGPLKPDLEDKRYFGQGGPVVIKDLAGIL